MLFSRVDDSGKASHTGQGKGERFSYKYMKESEKPQRLSTFLFFSWTHLLLQISHRRLQISCTSTLQSFKAMNLNSII